MAKKEVAAAASSVAAAEDRLVLVKKLEKQHALYQQEQAVKMAEESRLSSGN
jgi:hypothetical protein